MHDRRGPCLKTRPSTPHRARSRRNVFPRASRQEPVRVEARGLGTAIFSSRSFVELLDPEGGFVARDSQRPLSLEVERRTDLDPGRGLRSPSPRRCSTRGYRAGIHEHRPYLLDRRPRSGSAACRSSRARPPRARGRGLASARGHPVPRTPQPPRSGAPLLPPGPSRTGGGRQIRRHWAASSGRPRSSPAPGAASSIKLGGRGGILGASGGQRRASALAASPTG